MLGAGASRDAGIPISTEMTDKLSRVLNKNPHSVETQALNFICGALIAHDSAAGASPYDGLDVERVFAAVMLLAERRDLEITPFVASWHPAVNAWDRPRQASFFDDRVRRAVAGERGASPLGAVLANHIEARIGTGGGATYRALAGVMINTLRQLLAFADADAAYLRPIAEAARKAGGLTVATLNYDTTVEKVAASSSVQAYTGIASWAEKRCWDWPADGLRLMKLHGSIDWCWVRDGAGTGRLPVDSIVQTDDAVKERRPPAVVFGNRSKLTAKGPFLSLLAEFERILDGTDNLITIGYSFRDEHVNEVIRRWSSGDLSRRITIVDPGLTPQDQHGGVTVTGSVVSQILPDETRPDFRRDLLRALNPVTTPGQQAKTQRVSLIVQRTSQALEGLLS